VSHPKHHGVVRVMKSISHLSAFSPYSPMPKANAPSTASGATSSDANAAKNKATAAAAKIPEAELIGITVRKDGDFSDWYQQVLKKGDMLDYYDVSGCYILKPWSYTVWESIQCGYISFQPYSVTESSLPCLCLCSLLRRRNQKARSGELLLSHVCIFRCPRKGKGSH
jgi:hypothetical protein